MDISKVKAVVFSGAGTTRLVVDHLGKETGLPFEVFDVTPQGAAVPQFEAGDLAVFAVPAFGGRVPAPALERVGACAGCDTPTVLVVTYGNRAVDDTFLELADTVDAHGFVPVAGAAVVAHHSLMTNVAEGRPDEQDLALVSRVAHEVTEKLAAASDARAAALGDIPGKRPYTEYNGVPFHVKADAGKCTACGTCVSQCPVGAIDASDPTKTDFDLCVTCMRCAAVCPAGARSLTGGPALKAARAMFAKACGKRQESYELA